MKIHKHLVESIAEALVEIFQESSHKKYADKVVNKKLKDSPRWGSRDRRFFAESVYNCVRWWRKLWYLLGETSDSSANINLQKMKEIWGVYWLMQGQELPLWFDLPLQASLIQERLEKLNIQDDLSLLPIRESIPDWMNDWGLKERGARWPFILASLNRASTVDLRVNTLKTTAAELKRQLLQEEIGTDSIAKLEGALSLQERRNVFITKAFLSGYFEVQDRGSQRIAPFLRAQPGQRVIDACAGAGGKSLHLASLMKNKGKIIALDIHEWKLKELKERARRNGVDIIETRLIESTKTIKRLADSADRVLLDVPCSGMGVLRRNPDTKWKLSPNEVAKLLSTQAELLSNYSKMVKPGGFLVYATCSIMSSENDEQVKRFISQHKDDWIPIDSLQIDPDEGLGDGFYAALLQRNSTSLIEASTK